MKTLVSCTVLKPNLVLLLIELHSSVLKPSDRRKVSAICDTGHEDQAKLSTNGHKSLKMKEK